MGVLCEVRLDWIGTDGMRCRGRCWRFLISEWWEGVVGVMILIMSRGVDEVVLCIWKDERTWEMS